MQACLFRGGSIRTMAPDLTAEAVIVEGNTITYVGSEARGLILLGFIDAHRGLVS